MKKQAPILDLFEFYETLPQPVQDAINEAGEVVGYDECDSFRKRLIPLGYDFEYGLDAIPTNLHKINL
jgi:hypothetical protein